MQLRMISQQADRTVSPIHVLIRVAAFGNQSCVWVEEVDIGAADPPHGRGHHAGLRQIRDAMLGKHAVLAALNCCRDWRSGEIGGWPKDGGMAQGAAA